MSAPGSVTAEPGMVLIAPGQPRIPLAASLAYDDSDPYAVRVAFHVGFDKPVEWTFARDLLAEGATRRAGIGDVQVRPHATDKQVLCLELSSPFGEALFEVPAADVADFLTRTYRLVPRGSEPAHVDVDNILSRLLAGDGQG